MLYNSGWKEIQMRKLKQLIGLIVFAAVFMMVDVFAEEAYQTYFGVKIDNACEDVVFEKTEFASVEELKAFLDKFPNAKRIDLGETNMEYALLADLRSEYTDFELVWTMKFGKWEVKTDATAFSTLNNGDYRKPSSTFECLKYCNKLLALDLGHNEIRDLYFLEGMTELRYLILADNKITDISVLSTMPNLKYVELFFNRITDLNALSNLEYLVDLNVCFCPIDDYSALETLPQLERLWISSSSINKKDREIISSYFENCEINYKTKNAVEEGWRVHPHYYVIRDTFRGGAFIDWEMPPIEESTQMEP